MIKLAITGNIASGKSLIESLLQEEGIITLDTDEVVHKLLEEDENIIEKVNNLFEEDVKDSKGCIDRKKVGNIVFKDKNKLKQLEKIIHPEVKKLTEKFFQNNSDEKILAVSVPQLYEAGWEVFFDYVILVTAYDKLRIERLKKRNNLSDVEAQKRIAVQTPQEEKAKKADFVIDNSKDISETKKQLTSVLEKLVK